MKVFGNQHLGTIMCFKELGFHIEHYGDCRVETVRFRIIRMFGETRSEYKERVQSKLFEYLYRPSPNYDFSPTGLWFQSGLDIKFVKRNEWIAEIHFAIDC